MNSAISRRSAAGAWARAFVSTGLLCASPSFVFGQTEPSTNRSRALARTLAVLRILPTFTPPMRPVGYRCFCNGLKPPRLFTSFHRHAGDSGGGAAKIRHVDRNQSGYMGEAVGSDGEESQIVTREVEDAVGVELVLLPMLKAVEKTITIRGLTCDP
jgi:hypothetical protein